MDILAVVGVVHHSHLDGNTLLFGFQINDIVEKVCAVAIHIAHKLLQSVLGVEHLLLGLAFLVGAHVGQGDGDAGIQVSQFPHALGDDVIFVCRGGEYSRVGPELLARTCKVSLADNLHRIKRLTLLVFLLIDLSVAEHLREHVSGQGVHAAHTHTV